LVRPPHQQPQPALTGLPGPLNRFSPVDNKTPHLMTKAHRRWWVLRKTACHPIRHAVSRPVWI